jgi:NagD protein
LCLTNGSLSNAEHLRTKLKKLLGIDLPAKYFVNSAHSTAAFIAEQQPGASCFMIGSKALKKSLLEYGLKIVKEDPDYVVMGESKEYRYEDITNAINFVNKGARFIATNDDVVDIDEVIEFEHF